jgi:TolB-like protein
MIKDKTMFRDTRQPLRFFSLLTFPAGRGTVTLMPLILFLLTAVMVSCGYRFAGMENNLPPDIHSIAIPVFENKTSESGIENCFTNDFIYEFTRSKYLAIVKKKESDVVLTGIITGIRSASIAHTPEVVSAEERVVITIDVELQRTDNGEILWCNRSFVEKQDYAVETDKLKTEANKKAAIQVLSRRAAQKIHNSIFQSF